MGSKSNAFETLILQHIFQNADIANIGDAAGLQNSATEGSLYLRLCTSASAATDADAGTECAYTSYTQLALARNSGKWTVSGNQASNAAVETFATCTGGSETVRYVEVWTAASGGTRLYWTQLTSDLTVSSGIAPQFAIGAITFTED